MPTSWITKKALADAMKELMQEIPMEKIKIGDIVDHCDMNRQSFYYHFKDKYDLVNWIFYTEFVSQVQDAMNDQGWEILEKVCQFFYENRQFYSNALRVRGQNSFAEYFNEVVHALVLYDLKGYFKKDENQEFCATFLTDAICMAITRWLLEGAKKTPKEFVALIKIATDGITSKILDDDYTA